MTLGERCEAVRAGAGLFDLPERGELHVSGDDRVRWLDGMITNDVKALDAAGPGAVCRALLLTRQGRIVADFRVLHLGETLGLALPREGITSTLEHLEGFIIADDVTLADASSEIVRMALEGPRSLEVLAAAVGEPVALDPLTWKPVSLAGHEVRVAGYSLLGGGAAAQLFVPLDAAASVRETLLAAGPASGLVTGDGETLECLRIEAGEPVMGRELDGSVLPAEVGLDEAVSETKGCYTGQEVVARMRSRGRANHHLVGLRFPQAEGVAAGADRRLRQQDKGVGEITSFVWSPRFGSIGLGFVKADRSEVGTTFESARGPAVVSEVPFA